MITLRPANASDQKVINSIVRAARINPMHLHWQRFMVALDDELIVGVGQVKHYKDGSCELSSIAVIPAYQNRGIASQIITALMQREKGSIHLFCRSGLADFYQRFGFKVISMDGLPAELARIHSLGEWFIVLLAKLFPKKFSIIAMCYDPDNLS